MEEGARDFIQNKPKRNKLNLENLKDVNNSLRDSKICCIKFPQGKIKANIKV